MKHTFLDYIGQRSYLYFYSINLIISAIYHQDLLLFIIVSNLVDWYSNTAFKYIIKEPRPKRQIPFEGHKSIYYGMPSGHAQSAVYNSVILIYLTQSICAGIFSAFVCAATFYQRYKYRKHTLLQVFFGALSGLFVGYFCLSVIMPLMT